MHMLLYIPRILGVSLEVYFVLLILGVPTFFLWAWLLKKIIPTEKTRIIAVWIATITGTPIIYIGIIIVWLSSMSYYPNHDFVKEKWFADKQTRYELSKNIIESRMLIGKTKSDVRNLLGDEGNTDESNYWQYYLGFTPDFANIDPDVLVIEFRDGKVVRVGQHQT